MNFKDGLTAKINETIYKFRAGEDAAGNAVLSEVFDLFLKMIESSQRELPPSVMEKFVQLQTEMDNQNYLKIADLLEFEFIEEIDKLFTS